MKLPLLKPGATKQDLIAAIEQTDKALLVDKGFFKRLAKSCGKNDAERSEKEQNINYVIDLFDTSPATVIFAFNKRIAIRTVISNVTEDLVNALIENALNMFVELSAKGMKQEEIKSFALGFDEPELTEEASA